MLVAVTYLEQNAPDELRPVEVDTLAVRLVTQLRPAPELMRILYGGVGADCSWTTRLAWSDAEWVAALREPATEVWVAWCGTDLMGYAELRGGHIGDGATTSIKYLGLFPEYRGRGLGGQLLTEVTRRAWTVHLRHPGLPPVRRIELDTSELDSDAALPNYRGRGFQEVETRTVERPVVTEFAAPRRA